MIEISTPLQEFSACKRRASLEKVLGFETLAQKILRHKAIFLSICPYSVFVELILISLVVCIVLAGGHGRDVGCAYCQSPQQAPKGHKWPHAAVCSKTSTLSLASGALAASWALFLLTLYKAATIGSSKPVGAILVAIGAAAGLLWYLTC